MRRLDIICTVMCGLCHVHPKCFFFYVQEKIILERRAVVEQAEKDKLVKTLRNLDRMRVIKEDQSKLLNHIFCESTSGKFHKIKYR